MPTTDLGTRFWRACDILRRDDNTQSLLDYVEQISWLHLDSLRARVDALRRLRESTQAELAALPPAVLDKAFRGEL